MPVRLVGLWVLVAVFRIGARQSCNQPSGVVAVLRGCAVSTSAGRLRSDDVPGIEFRVTACSCCAGCSFWAKIRSRRALGCQVVKRGAASLGDEASASMLCCRDDSRRGSPPLSNVSETEMGRGTWRGQLNGGSDGSGQKRLERAGIGWVCSQRQRIVSASCRSAWVLFPSMVKPLLFSLLDFFNSFQVLFSLPPSSTSGHRTNTNGVAQPAR